MTEQRLDDATQPQPQQQLEQRILARQTARELTAQELDQVSGAMRGGYTATSLCNDCDACDL
ncbi:MAG TPA: hypothetical protein VGQ91_14675 [Ideonella sp.]|nr:hypothetical protein [Ideonella sp.]